MKTSKITNVTANGTFDSQFGKMYKFEVEFENGEYGEANCKTADQKTWLVGQTVNYELTPNANPKFAGKLKQIKENPINGSPMPSNTGLDVQSLIVRQNALTNSVGFHSFIGNKCSEKDITDTAEKFYNWVMGK